VDQAHGRGLPRYLARALPALVALATAGYAWMLGAVPEDGAARLLAVFAAALAAALVAAAAGGQVRRLNERLTASARSDALTGLLNRRAFEERIDLELERSRRSGCAVSVIVCDLDAFRLVNSLAGHDAGDEALRLVAGELKKWKRRIDAAARIGGEEFALVLPDTDERGALLVAERLRRSTRRAFADGQTPLTASYGVGSYPEHAQERDDLLASATGALRTAKSLGGNRSEICADGASATAASATGPAPTVTK
jgi:two-component system cell cycle response regulator